MFSYLRGHKITCRINGEWIYADTKASTVNNERPCGNCGLTRTNDGHDGCLGELSGIRNACCGHGRVNEAYLQYWNGAEIRGKMAIEEIERLKKLP